MDVKEVIQLFSNKDAVYITIKNTSHGDDDFRETLLVDFGTEKIVIKLAANVFTDEKHLLLWERIATEYRKLGYYCPLFIRATDGTYPTFSYKGKDCIVWGEEYSRYRSAEELIKEKFSDTHLVNDGYYSLGVYDFNIGGREVYINYIFRQTPYVSTWDSYAHLEKDDLFLNRIIHALEISKKAYSFSDLEKTAAPLLYKCIRPLWWYASRELKDAGTDSNKIKQHLDLIEYEQTREIEFAKHM